MDPFSRVTNEKEVELEEEVRERRRILLANGREDEVPVGRWYVEKKLERPDPGLVDLAPADPLVPISEVQPHEADELLRLAAREGRFQVPDGQCASRSNS